MMSKAISQLQGAKRQNSVCYLLNHIKSKIVDVTLAKVLYAIGTDYLY